MTTSFRARTLACALLATTALASPALAQSSGQPAYRNFDTNGVDLVRGDFVLSFLEGSIGSDDAALPLIRRTGSAAGGPSQWDGITFQMTTSGGTQTVTVTLGNESETFTGSNGSYSSSLVLGSTLTGGGSRFTYTMRDGTRIVFTDPSGNAHGGATNFCKGAGQPSCTLLPTEIGSPDRKVVTLEWTLEQKCSNTFNPDGSLDCEYFSRLASVSNSFGYSLAFADTTDSAPSSGPGAEWYRRTGARFYNNAVSAAEQASVSYSYPGNGVTDVTDIAGRTWRVTGASIRRPAATSDTTIVTTNGSGEVSSVTNEGVTTNYSRSVSSNTATMTVTDALGHQTVVTSDLNIGRPTSVRDPLGRTSSFQYDGFGRLTRATEPEGNAVQYTRDARGNVTETRAIAKPGSGAADVVARAAFPADCSNPATCNSPTSTTDARGNVTDYAYDATHGGLLSVTLPFAGPWWSWVRPQTRYSYTLLNGEYLLTGISACRTEENCAGRFDEVKTSIAYDTNGNVTSTSCGDGQGSLTATNAMTYDGLGNLVTVDGPLAGTADTTRFRYNSGRELVGTISPDPDEGGPLKPRAVRNTFNASGLLAKVETGTVDSQSDAHWGAMTALEALETPFDASARPTVQKLTAGGTTYSLSHTSYDALGRPECTAQRMNPAAFDSLPSSACSLGAEGSFGPDRIVKSVYDPAGQLTQVRTAVGTPDEAAEVTSTYTGNGDLRTVTDAENNKTSYDHDGHDRLAKIFYPLPSKGAGASSTTDYEAFSYDANGNVTAFRNRAGETAYYTFNAVIGW